MTLEDRLKESRPLLLDGAMGTELLRKGMDVSLPLWSAAAVESNPEAVLQIHRQYVEAGAEIITTNTFRTTPRTFRKIADDAKSASERARATTLKAVDLAKEAATNGVFVAGCIAPLEDCYLPYLYPGDKVAENEFAEVGGWLAGEGVDFFLLETMGRMDEALSALRAVAPHMLPRWVSFIVQDEDHLLGGGRLTEAIRAVQDAGANAILLNCANLVMSVSAAARVVKSTSLPVGLYPNLGTSAPELDGTISERYSPPEFAECMRRAIDLGVRIIGSCCGSGPEHTRTLRELILSL